MKVRIGLAMAVCLVFGCSEDDGETPASGGNAPVAGVAASVMNGGAVSGGASMPVPTRPSGGIAAPGGAAQTGGISVAGGTRESGGAMTAGASAGAGATQSGGVPQNGGATQSGGVQHTGGTAQVGGQIASGGAQQTGGDISAGGSVQMGGIVMAGRMNDVDDAVNGGMVANAGGQVNENAAMEDGIAQPIQMNPNMFDLGDLGACSGGACRADDGDVPADVAQQRWAQNNGESCIPAAKVNADIALGRRLSNGRTPNQALGDIEACLTNEDCFRANRPPRPGDGFGPPPMERRNKEKWDRCFEVLCACNNQIIDGPNIMCEMVYVVPVGGGGAAGGQPAGGQPAGGQPAGGAPAGGQAAPPPPKKTPADCNTPGSVAIFSVPGGSMPLVLRGYRALPNGEHELQVRDPNCPGAGTDPVDVNDEGSVTDIDRETCPMGLRFSAVLPSDNSVDGHPKRFYEP